MKKITIILLAICLCSSAVSYLYYADKIYQINLAEKEAAKEERKKLIQIKLACEKGANAFGKVSKECTDLVDEKDWDDIDKETEK